jgi:hypothetical protein
MFEKFKDVDVSAWGYDTPVKLRRMSAQARADWTNELARLSHAKIAGKQVQTDLQPGMSDIIYLEKIIVDGGPIKPMRAEIGELDWELIAYLAQEGEKLNAPLVLVETESD